LRPQLVAAEFRAVNLEAPQYVGLGRWCWDFKTVKHLEQSEPVGPRFLTAAQRSAAETEWQQIGAVEPWHATYLLHETLAWARKHPDDARLPEALHRAVQASRYRCTDADTGRYSKQAFLLLHQQYPKSKWTARTKYWYK
jgi:hypothetical protein